MTAHKVFNMQVIKLLLIDFYIKSGSGPHIIRNIFENVEYD